MTSGLAIMTFFNKDLFPLKSGVRTSTFIFGESFFVSDIVFANISETASSVLYKNTLR